MNWLAENRVRWRTQSRCQWCGVPTAGSLCRKHQALRAEIDQKMYQDRRAQGLCAKCGGKAAHGFWACGECRAKINRQRRQRRKKKDRFSSRRDK